MAVVKLDIEVDPKTGKVAIKEIAGGLDDLEKKSKSTKSALTSMFEGFGQGIGQKVFDTTMSTLQAIPGLVASAVTSTAKYADGLAELHDRTDLAGKSLQALEVHARLGGGSLESVAAAVNKMQIGLANGSTAFGKLGLDLKKLKEESPEKALVDVARAIDKLDPNSQAAARVAVFGKAGNELAGMLKSAAAATDELGGALSDKALKASSDLQDQLDLVEVAMERVVRQFGAAIAESPELQRFMEELKDVLVDIAQWVEQHSPEIRAFFSVIAEGARLALVGVRELVGGLKSIGGPVLDFLMSHDVTGLAANYQSKLKDARAGSGLSVTADVGRLVNGKYVADKPGSFPGAGDDAAAKARERELAKQRQDLAEFNREYEAALKKRETAYERMVFAQIQDADRLDKRERETTDAYNAMVAAQIEDGQRLESYEADHAARARERLLDQLDALDLVGSKAQELGQVLPGVFGTIATAAGTVVSAVANIGNNIDAIRNSGGGLTGILGKIGGGLGIASVVGSVVGFIGGLFGGGKKKREEEAAANQKLLDDSIKKLDDLKKRMDAIRMDKLQAGATGVAAVMHNLAEQTDITQERLNNAGVLGAAVFAEYRRQGLSAVDAVKAMAPALDQMRAAAEKNGLELQGTFGALAAFQGKIADNETTVRALEGVGTALDALRVTGGVTQETANAAMGEVQALFAELEKAGFTAEERVSLGAQALFDLKKAAADGKITLDDETQAMIDLAEQSGAFEGLTDPMQEMVEIQKLMLETTAALAKVFGAVLPAEVQKYIDALRQVPAVPVPGGAGVQAPHTSPNTGIYGPYGEIDVPGFAGGYSNSSMPYGPYAGGASLLAVHPRESVNVTPASQNYAGGAGPSPVSVTMPIDWNPQVSVEVVGGGDPQQIAEQVGREIVRIGGRFEKDLMAMAARAAQQVQARSR